MNDTENIKTELSLRRDEMDMQLRYVLQGLTTVLTEKDWERIEGELDRAVL